MDIVEGSSQQLDSPQSEQSNKPGFYLEGQNALYSTSSEKIAEKLEESNPDLKIEYRGDLNEELKNSLNTEDPEERKQRIRNVFSINLLELHNSNNNEKEFKEKLETTKTLVNTLLNQYPESFFLLFKPEHEPSTILHSLNVMALSLNVFGEITKEDQRYEAFGTLEEVALSALLHDMGKVKMRDIVQKKEKLTEGEWIRIRNHPKDGYDILAKAGVTNPKILNAAKYHHRRFDNTGYPEIDPGEEVGNLTYFIGLIDSIEAITSKTRIHNQNKNIGMIEAFGKLQEDMGKKPRLYPIDLYLKTANILLHTNT